jgi:hypothetical protein
MTGLALAIINKVRCFWACQRLAGGDVYGDAAANPDLFLVRAQFFWA